MNINSQNIIGELVAQDYRNASIFKSFGIDFCCRGNRSIEEVCAGEHINQNDLLQKLNTQNAEQSHNGIDFNAWHIDLLANYIEKKHHRYVEEKVVEIINYLKKICQVHGTQHPELFEVQELFIASSKDLLAHMQKEETILFPFINEIVTAKKKHTPYSSKFFDSVHDPISLMQEEHDTEGERFRKIARLCNNYIIPNDACNTYKVTLGLLKEFEEDLHLHIHLESNILFPKALAIEKELSLL